jgi:hypothetical protein
MHWTRPLDALVVAASLVPRMFMGWTDSLYWGALWLGPALHALLGLAIGWAALPLVGHRAWVVAALGVVVQPALLAYGSAGRADHHVLIFLLFAVLIGSSIRFLVFETGSAGRAAMGGGLVAGAGLWVSTEFLLPIALVLLGGAVAWVVNGSEHARSMARFSFTWFATIVVALALERGTVSPFDTELDRISGVHVALAAGATLVWLAVARLPAGGRGRRIASLAGVSAPLAAGFHLAFPSFLRGPFGDVPRGLWDVWLSRVVELQPLWPVGPNPGRSLYLLGAPVSGTVIALWACWADRRRRTAWWFVAGSLVVGTALGLLQLRMSAFAQVLATIPWAWATGRALERLGEAGSLRAAVSRVGAMVLGVSGFLVPALIASLLTPEQEPDVEAVPCSIASLARRLDDLAGELGEPPIVLVNPDAGPEVLYRSEALIVADPYHRNVDGILDSQRALAGGVGDAASFVRARGIDVIALCAGAGGSVPVKGTDPDDLYAELTSDRIPAWASLESTGSHEYLVFLIDPDKLPAR